MGEIDYYDVQAMIRDARNEIRGEIVRACKEVVDGLRLEIRALEDELASLNRVLQSRTEHLV